MSRQHKLRPYELDKFLQPSSYQHIDGFLFKGEIGSGSTLSELMKSSPFVSNHDTKEKAFKKSLTGLFRTIEFYGKFLDHPEFKKIVAEDLNWEQNTVKFVLQIFVWAREGYLNANPHRERIPTNAPSSDRLFCKFVDGYIAMTGADGPRFPWTPNRQEYLAVTRQAWRNHLRDNPQAVLNVCPSRPPRPSSNDWEKSGPEHSTLSRPLATTTRRSQSPAPLSNRPRSASNTQQYRRRSPLHGHLAVRSSAQDRQATPPLKQEDSDHAQDGHNQPSFQPTLGAHGRLAPGRDQGQVTPIRAPPSNGIIYRSNNGQNPSSPNDVFTQSNPRSAGRLAARAAMSQPPPPFIGQKFSDIITRALIDTRAFATQGNYSGAALKEIATTIKHLEVLAVYAGRADEVIHGNN